jgi:hypothetical protein
MIDLLVLNCFKKGSKLIRKRERKRQKGTEKQESET